MAWNEPGGGDNKDPWGGRGDKGPPDLDEVVRKMQDKLGGLFGGAVGNALDQRDKELAMKQAQISMNSGTTGSWKNPDSGNSGTFTPAPTYTSADGRECRKYSHDIVVGSETEKSTGTACRQADGTWKKVD